MLKRPLLLLATPLLFAVACKKPEPPQIVPKEARIATIGPQGIGIELKVDALNPNGFALTAQSVTAKAKLDGKYDLGSVTVPKAITLPPQTPTEIEATMTLPWTDVQTLARLLATSAAVPYAVEGTASIGGERLNANVPFAMTGTITRDQILGAAAKALPTIPGGWPLAAPANPR